jgi:hypothetical protein
MHNNDDIYRILTKHIGITIPAIIGATSSLWYCYFSTLSAKKLPTNDPQYFSPMDLAGDTERFRARSESYAATISSSSLISPSLNSACPNWQFFVWFFFFFKKGFSKGAIIERSQKNMYVFLYSHPCLPPLLQSAALHNVSTKPETILFLLLIFFSLQNRLLKGSIIECSRKIN